MFDNCDICGGPRKWRTTMIGAREFRAPTMDGHEDCAIELERRRLVEEQAQQKAIDDQRRIERLERGFCDSGVNWQHKVIDNLRPNKGHKAAYDTVKAWTPGKRGFVLFGPPGCGKTHLMVGMAKMVSERDRLDFRFIKINPWLDSLRGTDFAGLERELLKIEKVPLLFLDDLGAEKLTEWTESKIERVFDYRFEFELPTFISTNLDPDAMGAHLTQRLWSRLRGLSDFVKISGEDFRQKGTKK